jgi:hypothetical protein
MVKIPKSLQIAVLLVCLALLVSACVASSQPPAPASQANPTYYITQYVTQVVATAPTSTPDPTLTPTPWPTPTLEFDPFSVPVHYPLTGCAGSRILKGGMAFVAQTNAAITKIFSSPSPEDNPGMRPLVVGEILYIMDGAWCENKMLIWQVYALSDSLVGFVVEGDGVNYYLLPMSPKEPTPKVKPSNPALTPFP